MARKKKVKEEVVVDVPVAVPGSETIVNHAARAHYINGGSSINRRILCPGSAYLERQFPDNTSEYADRGTFIHEGIELALPQCFKAGKVDFVLPPLYTPDDCNVVEAALDNIWEIVGSIYNFIGWVSEKKFVLNHELELGGSADFAYAYNDTDGRKIGGIWDYKNGVMETDIIQCILYMVSMNESVKGGFDIMRGHIYQPNSLDQEKTIKFVELTREELANYREMFLEVGNVSLGYRGEEAMKLNPGVEQCRFCKAVHKCPAVREQNKALMDEIIVANSTDSLLDPEKLPKLLTDEQVLKWLKNSEYIKLVDKTMWIYAKSRYDAGDPLPGTKAVYGRSVRGWDSNKNIEEVEKTLAVLGVKDVVKKSLLGIVEIEKKMMKAKIGSKKDVSLILEAYTKRSEPNLSIVLSDESNAHIEGVPSQSNSVLELIINESEEEINE